MKKILGLDLGTNSIGWAVVEIDHDKRIVRIIALGSRIIPMNAGEISTFESGGKLKSSAANKTKSKSIRKNKARFLLRRDRLHCVLNMLNMLPEHYKLDIEFVNEKGKRSGKIIKGREPKMAYYTDENGKQQFYFKEAYAEMEEEFKTAHPELFLNNLHTKRLPRIPYDWTLYYLRKKGLSLELSKEELAWVIMSFLQKRGYEKVMGEDEKERNEGELSEVINAKVISVELLPNKSAEGLNLYHIQLVDEYNNIIFSYNEPASYQITRPNEYKQLEKITKLNNDENTKKEKEEIVISEIKNIEIVEVINTHVNRKEKTSFEIILDTGWKYEYLSRYYPKMVGTHRDFVITSVFDTKGNLHKRNISMPNEESKQLEKLKTENSIQEYNSSNRTLGVASYIYDALLRNPNQKIKAGLIETIERDYYRKELKAIIEKQKLFHPELRDEQNYLNALRMLYPNNETHRKSLENQDFASLLGEDIIFYQRDLKPKKSQIADCKYEYVTYHKDGKEIKQPLKCIAKSNPLYQEFRLWQFMKRLRIIQKESENEQGERLVNIDISDSILTMSVKESLFEYINNRKEITQSAILKKLKLNENNYKWNFEEDHKEPCNETRYDFVLRLKRIKGFDWEKFLNAKSKVHEKKNDADILIDGPSNEYLLWHFFYSTKKKEERIKGLPHLVEKLLHNADMDLSYKEKFIETISTISTYKNEYGTYSEKAIKKLLPFMRLGKYWNQKDVEQVRTIKDIKPEVLTKENINNEITDLQGLWVSSACYIVYGRYSEASDAAHWTQPYAIKDFLRKEFKHNSINNPVVEKVVREMLMIVHDIWTTYGETDGTYVNEDGNEVTSYKKYFDQINVEIGTSLKNNNKRRKYEDDRNKENKRANDRAYEMLKDLKTTYYGIEEHSPYQQEKIRILEAGALDSISRDKDDKVYDYAIKTDEKRFTKKEIRELIKKDVAKISKSDILRYRLWLEQRYRSPYTGVAISLSKLFDRKLYQIDHVFPQERVTLNSMSNKVICEANVNQAKGAMTGYEFILKSNGKTHYKGQEIKLLTPKDYVSLIQDTIKDDDKKEILLSKIIPDKFGNNQLNNRRYIAKLAMGILSNIVRDKGEIEYKSKNVVVVSGGVTAKLKRDWQLDETWNELIKPRFLYLKDLLESDEFFDERIINGHLVKIPQIPNKDIDKKRIDHRHHALDALIVALTTNNHVNYINNISALNVNTDRINERKDLKAKYMTTKHNDDGTKKRRFLPPMQYKEGGDVVAYRYTYKDGEPNNVFKTVALTALQNTLVTFKQSNRIMRQRINYIQHPEYKEGLKQTNLNLKQNYSIRQSLHKQTFYGLRNFCPKAIEEAIKKPDRILDNKVRYLIQLYQQQGMSMERIIELLKPQFATVYVQEKCVITQWSHQLEYLSDIKEREDDKKTSRTGKSLIIREIECVADITIQKILKNHLAKYDSIKMTIAEASQCYDDIVNEDQRAIVNEYVTNGTTKDILIDVFVKERSAEGKTIFHNPQIAFSTEGIKDMNCHITELNNGKSHKPIYKVKVTQALGKMFPIAEKIPEQPVTAKNKQYVISDAGSNNFCGIYKSDDGKTAIYVPSLKDTIEATRNNEKLFPSTHPNFVDFKYKFTLSPLDLVYVPTQDEIINKYVSNDIDYTRIYVVNDFNDQGKIYFRPYSHANAIIDKEVDLRIDKKGNVIGSFSDKTTQCQDQTIRDCCIPIKIDRLGNIIQIGERIIVTTQ